MQANGLRAERGRVPPPCERVNSASLLPRVDLAAVEGLELGPRWDINFGVPASPMVRGTDTT